ncbi:MAG: hypothetical protein AB2693_01775 [Candidatus Thiodiazotropha sp.]
MKLYVPNPQLWVDYFERATKGTSNQRGGGRRPGIIMVKPSRKKEEGQHISIKAVLPAEQTAAQAKSELVREDINPKEVERVFQNLPERQRVNKLKRKRPTSSSSASKKSKRQKRGGQKGNIRKPRTAAERRRDIFEIE